MRRWVLFLLLLGCYAGILLPLSETMRNRPSVIRIGYLPEAQLLKLVSADFQPLVAHLAVSRVLFYYGSLVDERFNRSGERPEYYQMFKALEKAIQLDPYNMDPYYFAQAIFTWELNKAADVNRLLVHGMKYRTWDYWLPFYVGFNAGYFLKDAETSARYLQQAAMMSGNKMFASLASRTYYQLGLNELALQFLETMMGNAKDDLSRRMYAKRCRALQELVRIEQARDRFFEEKGATPSSVEQLLQEGYLQRKPVDPYGGRFFLGEKGQVLTTSQLFDKDGVDKAW